tara:strand:+ start:615 stop:860 length:246 start_codon:yes stop_codon:yes gene_type:complete
MFLHLKKMFGLSEAHKRASKTYKELSQLTDHELKDIGICRGDIAQIAYDAVRVEEEKEKYEAGDHYMRGKTVATWKGKAHA